MNGLAQIVAINAHAAIEAAKPKEVSRAQRVLDSLKPKGQEALAEQNARFGA